MSMVPPEAVINKIIPLSVVDGPGCRTSVFVQGCNIACAYCHNPETQQLCSGCGLCVSQCPAGALSIQENGGETPKENEHDRVIWDESLCVQCDTCIRVCPSHASPKVRRMSAEDVWKEIEKTCRLSRESPFPEVNAPCIRSSSQSCFGGQGKRGLPVSWIATAVWICPNIHG